MNREHIVTLRMHCWESMAKLIKWRHLDFFWNFCRYYKWWSVNCQYLWLVQIPKTFCVVRWVSSQVFNQVQLKVGWSCISACLRYNLISLLHSYSSFCLFIFSYPWKSPFLPFLTYVSKLCWFTFLNSISNALRFE